MKSTAKSQVPPNAPVKNSLTHNPPDHPKLFDRYIIVCPHFFEQVLWKQLTQIDSVAIRDGELMYQNSPEDCWDSYGKDPYFHAGIWKSDTAGQRLIYLPQQGRLFACESIVEVGKIIEQLQAQEALKVIPPQSK